MKHHTQMTIRDIEQLEIKCRLLRAWVETRELIEQMDSYTELDINRIEKLAKSRERLYMAGANINLMLELL